MISVLEINHVKWSLFKKRNNTGAWGSIYRLHSKYHDVHDTYWVYVYIEIQAPVRKKVSTVFIYHDMFIYKDHEDPMKNYIEEKKKREKKERYMYNMMFKDFFLCKSTIAFIAILTCRIAYMDQMIFWSKFFIVCSHIVINFSFFLSSCKESLD